MGAMKTILHLSYEHRDELIVRLAEMAGILRGLRADGAAEPVLCLLDCDAHSWITFGPNLWCTNCGTRPLPASTWHRLLTLALKANLARQTWAAWAAAT